MLKDNRSITINHVIKLPNGNQPNTHYFYQLVSTVGNICKKKTYSTIIRFPHDQFTQWELCSFYSIEHINARGEAGSGHYVAHLK